MRLSGSFRTGLLSGCDGGLCAAEVGVLEFFRNVKKIEFFSKRCKVLAKNRVLYSEGCRGSPPIIRKFDPLFCFSLTKSEICGIMGIPPKGDNR